jgi:hypothetical protein
MQPSLPPSHPATAAAAASTAMIARDVQMLQSRLVVLKRENAKLTELKS